ncbi:MAG: hypothetical protein ACE5J5_00795 [Candidatus Hydrothermarchaeales archaeon]
METAVLIPEVNMKVGMTNYDPVNKYAIFAIIKDGNVTDYLTRDNVAVAVDLELIKGCYTPVQKVEDNYIEIAFACTGKPKMLLVANSIDYKLASGFIDYFENKDVTIIHVTAEQFNDPYKDYNQYQTIVILGGHEAPEGIGEITDQLLDSDDKQFLEEAGNRKMFDEGDRWGDTTQSVIIFAGSDRYQTKLAHEENRDKFIVE